ncbi:glycoside hydrolase family 3 C-terminal domain-containing protein [Murimonas intestini]|uniref:Beta-glucosidase n=1 Tax=Murimonas intestini TaxID=1337051 RepID=A0AB73T2H8_9FIRM|nr:glycoside hydrolase family 3 C-terminal domain-containing protein [Murimonas intestini]MCR1842650.1 glycoside hydrolase family 3 C-terminal domain-containing protein [Murimonas intestini]MCR1867303.1 glycoside hydrolase family 3 C-terminal domain-containing protein [Murimonas intestini]MCR1884490.1 glycoside hydrolase family 3 C-terminal domain-containing protein [Murimonas intestini]
MNADKIKELVSQMTLEEKASLCSGADFWHTKEIKRLGIPSVMVSDGPHGLRKQDQKADHLGVNDSIKAVCFPAGCATAASFNRDLIKEMGETLGNECQAEKVSVILGPAVNIKRSPLCGRNFEYYSEDPLVATEMAGSLIEGIQNKNIGTSIKHFLANNQETRRMSSSSDIDERTLREIYLAAFEGAVCRQKPWTVMCSYNKINGTYAAENKTYLTDVLRNEWGFDGFVMSDWGAVNDRVRDLEAGLNLEMPSSSGINDKLITEAVRSGRLDEQILDRSCEEMLNIIYRAVENQDENAVFDLEKDHEKARKIAEETIVLLKNEDILPLNPGCKIAFIGKYAKKPRYQGGGSSHINSFKVTSALEAAGSLPGLVYAQGYDDARDEVLPALEEEAVRAAGSSDVAVIFAGLPDAFESEGFDRSHMRMPDCQNQLIEKIAAVQPNTVVVLHNGSPVEMPWISKVKGVIEAYLSGQAVGAAVTDILFGRVNPSAKLPETFPLKLEDNPSHLTYPGEGDRTAYAEGVYVGYRYYDKKKMDVLFPFGHGLSYTSFSYSDLTVDKEELDDTDTLKVSVKVTNTGKLEGKEIIQLYVGASSGKIQRPVKELRDFAKISLKPGETKEVTFTLGRRAFAYWNTTLKNWHVLTDDYDIMIGASSRDIRCQKSVRVNSTVRIPVIYTLDTTFGDVMENEKAAAAIHKFMEGSELFASPEEKGESDVAAEAISAEMQEAMMRYMPLRGMISFSGGAMTLDKLEELILEWNRDNINR